MSRMMAFVAAPLALGCMMMSAMPAQAATKSGKISCTSGAHVGVKGQQSRYTDRMVLVVNGSTIYSAYNVTTAYAVSGATSGAWTATSNSLVSSGTNGYCAPLVG